MDAARVVRTVRERAVFVGAAILALWGGAGCAGLASSSSNSNPKTPPPASISVSVEPGTASVLAGTGTQSFTATVHNDPQNKGVAWTLSGAGCAGSGCGALSAMASASGVAITYTAPSGAPTPASVTLTANSVSDTTKSAAATITVTAPPAISVSVAPQTQTVQAGHTQTFTATVSNDSQNKGVTWTLGGTGCTGSACGTLSATTSASGIAITYTAPNGVPNPASVTLTASSVSDTTKSAAATIAITAPPAISVSVAPQRQTVQAGHTQAFTATVSNDSQNKGVTWTLSGAGCNGNTCGALSAASSASGVAITYTAPSSALNPTSVALTARSVGDATKSAVATITVAAPPAISVTVAPQTQTVQVGRTQQFTATVSNDPQNKGVTWTLGGTGCTGSACGTISATASASGVAITYTAPATAPTPAGVTLAATSVADGTKSAAATITISNVPLPISVSVSPKRGGLTVNQALNVSATLQNDVGGQGVTWSATGGAFTNSAATTATYQAPAKAGVYTITATSVADPTKSASLTAGVTDLGSVATYHNNTARDGTNTQEYALTTTNVGTTTFGKVFSCAIDGPAYAQPLWVANLAIGGGIHNVIFVGTVHDSVYAFDADASPCVTYWHKSLAPSGETYLSFNDVGTDDIYPDVGIIGTPVIDVLSATLYVVSKTENSGTGCNPVSACHQRLHALSLTDGSEKSGGPVAIDSSIAVAGSGDGSSGGSVAFHPLRENERSGLALVNGVVYVAWASHGDNGPYHGWVMGFDKTTLARVTTYNDSPNGRQGGIWMGGGAPAADSSNNLYVITGNGDYDGVNDFGDSFLRLNTSGGLLLADWFTPYDQSSLDGGDQDVGSGGAVVLVDLASGPVQHLLIGGGKAGSGQSGEVYVVNRTSMGHNQSGNNSQIVQEFPLGAGIFSTAAFWQNTLYIAGAGGPVKAFALNPATSMFNPSPTSSSGNGFGFPGATPSVSSTGATNGIVWAIDSGAYGRPCCSNGPAVLHAYDATKLGTELWNSSKAAGGRDQAGNAVKFTVPTVANGKVYVGTRSEITVYGLLPN